MTKASLEGICDPCTKELSWFVIGDDRGAGEEDAVAQRERHVTAHLPVEKNVGLEPKIALVQRRLVDGGAGRELVENEQVHACLELFEGAMVRQREGDGAGAEG